MGPQSRQALRRLVELGLRLFLLAAGEAVAAALHGGKELLQVHFEGVEDLVGVVLGAEADFPLAVAGVLDDLVGGALGLLGDLLVGDQAGLLLAGLADDPLRLAFGLGQHLLALLDDPPRLLDLLGDRRPHLVEEVVDLLAVHANLIRQGNRTGVVNYVIELVYEDQDVHKKVVSLRVCGGFRDEGVERAFFCKAAPIRTDWSCTAYLSPRRSFRALATAAGTRSETSPPKVAISFTPVDERKL